MVWLVLTCKSRSHL